MLAGILLVVIFSVLSALHWYWVVGGAGGLTGFVPEIKGKPAFEPGRFATAIVATLLLFAAGVCASQVELFGLPRVSLARAGVWVLLVVFAARGIGEFRLVGLFKRVRDTRFGRLDTWVFSPLCIAVSVLCGALLYSTQ